MGYGPARPQVVARTHDPPMPWLIKAVTLPSHRGMHVEVLLLDGVDDLGVVEEGDVELVVEDGVGPVPLG